MVTAKVGRRGQLTLPKDVRETLGVEQGSSVAFVVKNGEVTLQPLTRTLRDLRGSVKVEQAQDFSEIRGVVMTGRTSTRVEGVADEVTGSEVQSGMGQADDG